MADTLDTATPTRRRRSDARRSIDVSHHRYGSDHAPEEHTATVRCHRA
jgi:hypothetical protein